MDWEPDAAARLEKVPFFIRKKVKKQIEQYVQDRGGSTVTGLDVAEARRALAGEAGTGENRPGGKDNGTVPHTAGGLLSAGDIERIEKMVESVVDLEGLNTRCRQVKVCGGAAGCPLSLIQDRKIAQSLARVLDQSGLEDRLAGRVEGPVLFHHKFKVAVAGCPNACSQPQIVDFGVIGQSRPGRGEDPCTGCGLCVETCRENAITLAEEGPGFDFSRCLNCGQCIQACPAGAIKEEESGFKVLAGGKLGRHPRLAETLLDLADEDQLVKALGGVVRVYMDHGRSGERLAGLVDRLGIGRIREMIAPSDNEDSGPGVD
ncbi:MAG: 4Fe-4S binding protein [Peptococcaceae bacterium]|nr:4Fe-4S binding protein [Peptococcaceae bacterium]